MGKLLGWRFDISTVSPDLLLSGDYLRMLTPFETLRPFNSVDARHQDELRGFISRISGEHRASLAQQGHSQSAVQPGAIFVA